MGNSPTNGYRKEYFRRQSRRNRKKSKRLKKSRRSIKKTPIKSLETPIKKNCPNSDKYVDGYRKNIPRYNASEFENDILRYHNNARFANGIKTPLVLDKALTQRARDWAEHIKLTNNCSLQKQEHSGKGPENIYVGWGDSIVNPKGALEAVQGWYSECSDYKPSDDLVPKNFNEVGHYTQMMWKDATKVGCARVECPNDKAAIVCNYDKGNVGGQFKQQVAHDKSKCKLPKECSNFNDGCLEPISCLYPNLWIKE
jgi:hypothetical protein